MGHGRWDGYMPIRADEAAAVLSPIKAAVERKASEVWGREGFRARSANEVIKTLFEYFDGLLTCKRAFIGESYTSGMCLLPVAV